MSLEQLRSDGSELGEKLGVIHTPTVASPAPTPVVRAVRTSGFVQDDPPNDPVRERQGAYR